MSNLDVIAVMAVTLVSIGIGLWGIRISRTTSDFLGASRSVSPFWNASAIGGEYLSAASFLGIAGLVYLYGIDMLWFPIGYTMGYLTLLLISENVIVEANPFMAFCLDFGQAPFFWVKYALMAVSLLIFCIFRSFRFSNVALAGSIMLYGSVVLYQVHLVYQHAHQLFR